MPRVSFDVGRLPSVLLALQDPSIAQQVANVAAESFNDDIHDWIDGGHSFTSREGQLQQSINWHSNGDGSATVYANADYAEWVEKGTRAHVIRPRNRNALRFPVSGGGGFGFARVINHPGCQAKPFFFADQAARNQRMTDKTQLIFARIIDSG